MDPPAFRTTPLSTLRKPSPSAEKRNRRAIQETNAAAREMADYWAQYSPTTVQGTDGHTYQVEGRRTKDTATGRALWSISLSGNSINISIPLCSFQVIGGSQPPVKINGTAVDYADPTKNILPLSSDLSLIALECEIDDTRPEAINTAQVNVVSVSPDKANTATRRYIPIAIVQVSTRSVSSPYLSAKAITTARRGDRDSTSNMVWF